MVYVPLPDVPRIGKLTRLALQTESLASTWAWRIPSLLQAAPSLFVFILLTAIPESPRWLISRGRHDEAKEILAIVNATSTDEVQVQYREIVDTIAFEKARELSPLQALSQKANRKRLAITSTFSIIVMLPGTNIVTFYFGDILSGAGIENPTTQLQVNVILTSWTLIVAVVASYYADWLPRKALCSWSLLGQIITLFLLAGLTKLYGTSSNDSGIYATIAMIFLYNATYAWGITPLVRRHRPPSPSHDDIAYGLRIPTLIDANYWRRQSSTPPKSSPSTSEPSAWESTPSPQNYAVCSSPWPSPSVSRR